MNSSPARITPVIMCGGSGTRLWPLSRETQPKQFFELAGGLTTFQQTLRRVEDTNIFNRPIIVTNSEFRFMVADQLQSCGRVADILLEPLARDSAPAICVASEFALHKDPNSTLLVLASDHIIRDEEEFRTSCIRASLASDAGRIVTFGVRANTPSSNYGYIRPGEKLIGTDAFSVDKFVEKPTPDVAASYVQSGYLWNSGNFLFRAGVMLGELERFEPEMRTLAKAAIEGLRSDLDFERLPAEIFGKMPKKSIDYAVMEHTPLAAVLPVDFGWSDIGSWNSLWQESDRNAEGNAVSGPAMLIDTRDSLVRSDETILTAVVGLENIIVVTTSDAVLVMAKDKSEKVKELVAALKTHKRIEATEHKTYPSTVGLLPRGRRGFPLPGQTHRCKAGWQALPAKASSPG